MLIRGSIVNSSSSLRLFKGIALFTPGGDLIYCIDPSKQSRWHLDLCLALQQQLRLPEPPHFLVPCYTATIDRWLDPRTQTIRTIAEASPSVLRYQPLLNAIFETEGLLWQPLVAQEAVCNPVVLAAYRGQFPQLWNNHDLLIHYDRLNQSGTTSEGWAQPLMATESPAKGYVLRLFVSGYTHTTERTLQNLHKLLEQFLSQPYTLQLIDVLQRPDLAERDHISATPTLVKAWPQPVRRIVGNFDSPDQLIGIFPGA